MTTFTLDCAALKKSGFSSSGIYTIDPDGKGSMNVSCDMVTDGGGWTVIQRRVDDSVDFYLEWANYKRGFGSLTGNFWLGNDNVHRLTTNGNTMLRLDLEDWSGETASGVYRTFVVDDESNKYKLTITDFDYSSSIGGALSLQNQMFFSTKDRNNLPPYVNFKSAQKYTGAWWYSGTYESNLNGQYLGNARSRKGIVWYTWKRDLSLKRFVMKIRSKSFR